MHRFTTASLESFVSRYGGHMASPVQAEICCPCHDDRNPSLGLNLKDDGNIRVFCQKGCDFRDIRQQLGLDERANGNGKRIVATYPYVDERGEVLYEAVRFEPKDFRQRRPDGKGGHAWSLKGVRRVLYRLPEVLGAIADGRPVFLVEGEKDADRLAGLGLAATTAAGGSVGSDRKGSKWKTEYSDTLRGADVVIVPDRDEAGDQHAETVAGRLAGIAVRVRVVHLPALEWRKKGGPDVSDWLAAGHTLDELLEVVDQAPDFEAAAAERSGTGSRATADAPTPTFNLTDLGNAERFVADHGQDVRYLETRKMWLSFRGPRWDLDEDGEIMRRAHSTVRSIYDQASSIADDDLRQRYIRHALGSEKEPRLRAIPSLARDLEGVKVHARDLDRDPFLLGVRNGVVDLRTGDLRDGRREDLITMGSPVAFDPRATCQRWLDFLDTVMGGDPELVAFLQRAAGYTLTGSIEEHCLFLLHGLGRNGKSTFLSTLLHVVGGYGQQADFTTFLENRSDKVRNDLAALASARMVCASESSDGRRLDEAVIKQMTGGDVVTARFLNKEFFSYVPTFSVWLASNHRPTIRGTDIGIWRRIRLVPFEVTIPEGQVDKRLPAALRAEAPGILRWAVEGCIAWQRDGLAPPTPVLAATQDYRTEMDLMAPFLEEVCHVEPTAVAGAAELWTAWKGFCEAEGLRPGTKRRLSQQLRERGFEPFKGAKGMRLYHGLAVRGGVGGAGGGGSDESP